MTEKTEKITVEESTTMSLDDYIRKSGITDVSKNVRNNHRNRNRNRNRNNNVQPMDYDPEIPNASSLQWRLVDPNRPAGIPPLIPSNAKQKSYFNGQCNGNNRNNNRRRNQSTYADRDIPSNNNGINRNNQPNFKPYARPNSICGNVSNALVPFISNPNNAIATINNFSQGLAAEYMNKLNMMMEKWDEVRQIRNQPKYDMKVQKEIADIQGKPFIYTCNSGAPQSVVSFDGPGLDDCTVKVVTTDTSLNQRFH